jgi:predicted acylesterase/phospholipase RssA
MTHKKHNKIALVLAGGGLTGAVYEIGALRAIDDLLVDRTVNDFDIFVGTSAGALVTSFIANGVSPEEMLASLDGSDKEILPIKRSHVFSLNPRNYFEWGLRLPGKLAGAWSHYLHNINDMTFFDLIWTMTEALPSGLYSSLGLENFVRTSLKSRKLPNRFDQLERELYIIATDLDNGERAVFGPGYNQDVPISMAVAASSALPLIYQPVKIGNNEYVDGALRGNASLDLAIERGATLVVCINPMVPFDNTNRSQIPFLGPDGGMLGEKGVQSIANQSLRIFTHAGLHYHIKQLRRTHPEVDIILIEPQPDDYQMFFYNIMRYSARLIVARHGFESVTLDLAQDYPYYKSVLARHGIPISRRLVIEELAEIVDSEYDPQVIRRVLEARRGVCSPRDNDPLCDLSRTLAELEHTLEQMEESRKDSAFLAL